MQRVWGRGYHQTMACPLHGQGLVEVECSDGRDRSPNLHCLIDAFRFLGFLLWFREAPGGPGKAHGGGARVRKPKAHTFRRALLNGPDTGRGRSSHEALFIHMLRYTIELPGRKSLTVGV